MRPAACCALAWFPDGAGGDLFDEKEFRDPLAVILREAIDFISFPGADRSIRMEELRAGTGAGIHA